MNLIVNDCIEGVVKRRRKRDIYVNNTCETTKRMTGDSENSNQLFKR